MAISWRLQAAKMYVSMPLAQSADLIFPCQLSLLVYPSLALAGAAIHTEHELYDATFSKTDVSVIVTATFH